MGIFTAPIFSRLLGSSGYGIVSIYNTWVSVASVAFSVQVQGPIPSAKAAFAVEEQDAYQSSVTGLSILAFAVFSALVLIFLKPVSQVLQLNPFLISMILLQAFFDACLLILNQKFVFSYRADFNCLISLLLSLTNFALSLLFIWLLPREQGYYGRILGMTVSYALLGGFALFYIFRTGKVFYNRRYWKFCLPLAIPLIFYNLSDLMLGLSDQVMLQHMMSDSAVGIYSLTMSFSTIMLTIYGALNTSWVPFFFDDLKQGRRENACRQAGNFMELFTVLTAGFLLLHREVYHIFAGREFWEGTRCIPVLTAGVYLTFLSTYSIQYEYFHKKTKAAAVITILSVVLNIGLNFLLIPGHGMVGAAGATAGAHAFQFLCHYFYAQFYLPRGGYPIRDSQLFLGVLGFVTVYTASIALEDLRLLRWTLGACLGLWELLRLKKRRTIF